MRARSPPRTVPEHKYEYIAVPEREDFHTDDVFDPGLLQKLFDAIEWPENPDWSQWHALCRAEPHGHRSSLPRLVGLTFPNHSEHYIVSVMFHSSENRVEVVADYKSRIKSTAKSGHSQPEDSLLMGSAVPRTQSRNRTPSIAPPDVSPAMLMPPPPPPVRRAETPYSPRYPGPEVSRRLPTPTPSNRTFGGPVANGAPPGTPSSTHLQVRNLHAYDNFAPSPTDSFASGGPPESPASHYGPMSPAPRNTVVQPQPVPAQNSQFFMPGNRPAPYGPIGRPATASLEHGGWDVQHRRTASAASAPSGPYMSYVDVGIQSPQLDTYSTDLPSTVARKRPRAAVTEEDKDEPTTPLSPLSLPSHPWDVPQDADTDSNPDLGVDHNRANDSEAEPAISLDFGGLSDDEIDAHGPQARNAVAGPSTARTSVIGRVMGKSRDKLGGGLTRAMSELSTGAGKQPQVD